MKKISILLLVCAISVKAVLHVENNLGEKCEVFAVPSYVDKDTGDIADIAVSTIHTTINANSSADLKEKELKHYRILSYSVRIKCSDRPTQWLERRAGEDITINDSLFSVNK